MAVDRLQELYRLRVKLDREIARLERAGRPAPESVRRSKHDLPECGTETAYQRHRDQIRRHGAPPLDPATDACGCLAAHAAHNREQDAINRANRRATERALTRLRLQTAS